MPEVKSTLVTVDSHTLPTRPGVTEGQVIRNLIGTGEVKTDRMRALLATYEPGSIESLHWHQIEAFHYIVSGHGIVRDIEGNETPIGPGSFVYAPPGLAGSHEWEALEDGLELVSFRATTATNRKFQFSVDKETLQSHIDVDELTRVEGISFESHY